MIFAVVFFLNAAANFALGIVLGALLGPTEFGRFATVTLGASTLGVALFDWLRLSSIRFSAANEGAAATAANLNAGYLAMMALAVAVVGVFLALGLDSSVGTTLVVLAPLMAVAYSRSDFTAAAMRARRQGRAYAALAGIRHALTFTVVVGVAAVTRSAAPTIAALAGTTAVSLIALAPAMRTPGARLALADRRTIARFLRYSYPIVASTILYLGVQFVDRQFALRHFGAAATGKLSLATDLGFRVFLAINFLPETLLFQHAVQRETEEGREAAERQIAVNVVWAFAILAPLAVGFTVMAPTFEAIVAPPAFRGDFGRLSVALAPGFFAYCALMSFCNPVFQLRHKTWPLTLAAAGAFAVNLALLYAPGFVRDVDGVARAFSISLWVGFAVAAGAALRLHPVWPRWRDLLLIAAAAALMAAVVRPLNGLDPPLLAAVLALALGGAAFAAPLLLFNAVGCRDLFKTRARGGRFFFYRP